MAGTRDHGRYNRSGLDIDAIMAEFRRSLPPEPAVEVESVPERHLFRGGDPDLTKGQRRQVRRHGVPRD